MVRVLLLENIHPSAQRRLSEAGHDVECLSSALTEEQLFRKLDDVDVLGIRSGTTLSSYLLKNNKHLLAIGCFCIGTNQVDLEMAEVLGIPVFNAPYASSRSVAELIVGMLVNLSRQLGDRNQEMHAGTWKKTAKGCHELRGKTVGIIGYGHIGSQLGILFEALGLKVLYYDVVKKLSIGNAQPCASLDLLLSMSDFVTLHVPLLPSTVNLITARELALMKPGSYLLNASRGTVVSLTDVVTYLDLGHLAGAYFDVYPQEPEKNGPIPDNSPIHQLRGRPNVFLTPHIGGATEEAQQAIAEEVAERILNYIDRGATEGAVNFPILIAPPLRSSCLRILNIHHNIPGVLRDLTKLLDRYNINYHQLATTNAIGMAIIDIDNDRKSPIQNDTIFSTISFLDATIKTRLIA